MDSYENFLATDGSRLRRLLVAHYGVDVGVEATSDALAWAWEHWDDLAPLTNRVGYLYRVAQSTSRRYWRWRRRPTFPLEAPTSLPDPRARPPGCPGSPTGGAPGGCAPRPRPRLELRRSRRRPRGSPFDGP